LREAAVFALGILAQAATGAWLLGRVLPFRRELDRMQDVLSLAAAATCGAVLTLLAEGTVVGLLRGAGGDELYPALAEAWARSTLGVLVILPLLLTWKEALRPRQGWQRLVEAAVLAGLLVLLSAMVFGGWTPQ